jgi:hypothetical protein
MAVYTPPALTAVDFALTTHTPPSLTPAYQALTSYSVPALTAVDFALVTYTAPTYPYVGWELLPGGGGFPTQFSGLRTYYSGAVRELCLVAEADAPTGMGGVLKVDKNGTLYAVYLVELADTNATPVRVQTSTGTKAIRLKT